MPVIGNLDRQVDEVIISPVSKRQRGEEPPDEETHERPPTTAPETHTPTPDQSSAERDELPVWLL